MTVMNLYSKKLFGFLLVIFGLLPMSVVHSQEPIVIKIESLSKPEKPLWTTSKEAVWEYLIRAESKIYSYEKIPFDCNIIAVGEVPDTLVNEGFHPFLWGMYEAYSQHRPFVISPDMINLLICQGFSKHVNVNSEALRDKFTDSKEKTALFVCADGDLVYDSVNWGLLFNQFSDQIAAYAGQELVDAMTNDFTTTGLAERIASQITLMDATKPYFDFYVTYAICGIPEVTLLGTTEDWQKIYDHLSVFESYDLKWWTSELKPVLSKIIETTQGKKDIGFWRNMFKVHTSKEYGDLGSADGWILKFFPYDSDGNRLSMKKLKVDDIKELPHEMVKVEVYYQITDGINLLKEIPLEVWAGFVGLEQNNEDFTLKPIISWMVRKNDLDDSAMVKKIQKRNTPEGSFDGLILTELTEVPLVLKHFDMFFRLGLCFKDKVFIPEWMKDIEIGFLTIEGDISSSEKKKIKEWFPKTDITINKKHYQKGVYTIKELWCWDDNDLMNFYQKAEELSLMEEIWVLIISNFQNCKGENKALIIPRSLEKVKISYLVIKHSISEESLQRIMEQFPNTVIYVDGEVKTK
jgi:hypothetical protein